MGDAPLPSATRPSCRDRPPTGRRDLRHGPPLALGATPFLSPLGIGHECVAEVLTAGSEVDTVQPGQRVVVPFQVNCGTCSACQGD